MKNLENRVEEIIWDTRLLNMSSTAMKSMTYLKGNIEHHKDTPAILLIKCREMYRIFYAHPVFRP